MIMLDELKEQIDKIELEDDFAYNFITNILIQKEEQPEKQLTTKQFKLLQKYHDRYCYG